MKGVCLFLPSVIQDIQYWVKGSCQFGQRCNGNAKFTLIRVLPKLVSSIGCFAVGSQHCKRS